MFLHNGDCLEEMKKIADESVDCIVTDPPYGVSFKNNFYNDDKEKVFSNVPHWFKEYYRIMKDDSFMFIFVGVKTIHNWIQAGIDAGFEYKNIIATRSFNNGSPTPKNNFGFQFQPILVFSKGKGRPFNKVDFIGMEIDKHYFDLSKHRIEKAQEYIAKIKEHDIIETNQKEGV